MRVGDHELDPAQDATEQTLQKGRPEDLRLRRPDMQADDLALAVRVHRDRHYGRPSKRAR